MAIFLMLHSLWRWVVLLVAVAAVGKALVGWLGKQNWQALDDRLGLFFTIALDIQVLLGIILLILGRLQFSPRFWGEHIALMLISVAVAHIARSRARKTSGAANKFRTVAVGFLVSLVLIVIAIPR